MHLFQYASLPVALLSLRALSKPIDPQLLDPNLEATGMLDGSAQIPNCCLDPNIVDPNCYYDPNLVDPNCIDVNLVDPNCQYVDPNTVDPACYDPNMKLRKRQDGGNVTLPAPIVATPSQWWEGADGQWSTFTIRVGTPPRTLRVLPATSWAETWVIGAHTACAIANVSENCQDSRGGAFNFSSSSTWEDQGNFELGMNNELGYGGLGLYGFDSVGLGYDNSQGKQLPHQIVSAINSEQFWLGFIGLGFQPSNFTDYGDPQASFAGYLESNGSIASRSWSYTAGAIYRGKGMLGSLVWGGKDTNRYEENDVVFTMAGDVERDLVVTVQRIGSSTEGSQGNTTLYETPEFYFIDSTVPDLWLPKEACTKFEQAFGIKPDESSGRYLLTDEQHSNLSSSKPTITFTLSNQKEAGGSTVDISLPYGAFDLSLSVPLAPNGQNNTKYFPLRQANDSTQYTLGRVFLQEAYVTTHYNSQTFNVSKASHPDPPNPAIVAIPDVLPKPTNNNETTDPTADPNKGNSSKLATGAIVGIVIAAALGGLLIVTLIFFLCPCGFCPALTICGITGGRRRKEDKLSPKPGFAEMDATRVDGAAANPDPGATAWGAQASKFTNEMPGEDAKVEIAGRPVMHPQELPAEVPPEVVQKYEAAQAARAAGISSEETRVEGSSGEGNTTETEGVSSMSAGRRTSVGSPSQGGNRAELASEGVRELNGPETREGRVEYVSPMSARNRGWNREGASDESAEEGQRNLNSPTETATTWSPRTPVRRGWRDSDTD